MKKFIITEEEKRNILEMYNLINESSGGGLYLAEVIDFSENKELRGKIKSISKEGGLFHHELVKAYDDITEPSEIKIIFPLTTGYFEKGGKEEFKQEVKKFINEVNKCNIPIKIPVYIITEQSSYGQVDCNWFGWLKFPKNPKEVFPKLSSKLNLKNPNLLKYKTEFPPALDNYFALLPEENEGCGFLGMEKLTDRLRGFLCSLSLESKWESFSDEEIKKLKSKNFGFIDKGVKDINIENDVKRLIKNLKEGSLITTVQPKYILEFIIPYGDETWKTKIDLVSSYNDFISKANQTCKLSFPVGVKLTTYDKSKFNYESNSDGIAILITRFKEEIKNQVEKLENLQMEEIDRIMYIYDNSSHDKDLFSINKHYVNLFCSMDGKVTPEKEEPLPPNTQYDEGG